MRLERRPEKTCQKKNPVGKQLAGNLGRNQGSSFKGLEAHHKRLLQKEETADPTNEWDLRN